MLRLMGNAPRQTAAGVYHLATRSSTPDFLFRDAADRLSLIGQLERVTLDTDWTCLAACLMGTHYHLLVDAAENVLPDAMKRINWAYAVNHNRRHGRRGHRVGSRYLSIDVTVEEHLLACYRYIAWNPVEAGLCPNPEDWPWSSYGTTIGLPGGPFPFVDPSLILDTLDPDHAVALEELQKIVHTPDTSYAERLPVAFRTASRDTQAVSQVSDTWATGAGPASAPVQGRDERAAA
jgi:REP element-mobilizing transposase RayT